MYQRGINASTVHHGTIPSLYYYLLCLRDTKLYQFLLLLKVREHSELLYAQYLARCLEPGNVCHSITTRETPRRRMKETLFTRHRNTVEPMMLANNRKATLQAIHYDAVNKAAKDQKKNIVLDGLPHPINDSEKDLTRKERATLVQLRSGYCKLLGSYKSRIKKDASLYVCADCGKTPHDVKHLFACRLIRRH